MTGGAPLVLSDAPSDAVSPTGTWNRDGVILFGTAAGLRRVSASGGGATPLTEVAEGETGHGYPQFLPDGRRFLYFVASADQEVQGVYASALDTPTERELIVRTAAKAVYVPPRANSPGSLLWLQDETLVAQAFDADTLQRTGDPVPVAEEIGILTGTPRATFWASDTGLLAYFTSVVEGTTRRIVWVGRDGTRLEGAAPEDSYLGPLSLSPDAGRLAVTRAMRQQGTAVAQRNLWIWDLARRTMTRVTFDVSRRDSIPVWSPDGRHLVFSSVGGANPQIYRTDVSGTGQEELLLDSPTPKQALDWSRDGRYLLYREGQIAGGGDTDLMALPLEGDRQPFPVVQTRFRESNGKFSPDGRWIAYGSTETGRMEIYVQAFNGPGATGRPSGRRQVSNAGGSEARWRADGRELYYVAPGGRVMAVEVAAGPQGLEVGMPRELFSVPDMITGVLHAFDVTGDGQRFLLALDPSGEDRDPTRLAVIANWRLPARRE